MRRTGGRQRETETGSTNGDLSGREGRTANVKSRLKIRDPSHVVIVNRGKSIKQREQPV